MLRNTNSRFALEHRYKTKSFVSDSFKSSSIVPAQSIATATATEQDDDDEEEKQSGFDGEMLLLRTRLREMENQALVGEQERDNIPAPITPPSS